MNLTRRRVIAGALLLSLAGTPLAGEPAAGGAADAAASSEPFDSVFAVYADNRERGIPSYVTADLPLVAYALLRERSVAALERERVLPLFEAFLGGLSEALDAVESDGPVSEVTMRNRAFVSLLDALRRGDPGALDEPMREEYERVLGAAGVESSTLWSRPIDYSQFAPRGRYAGDPELEGHFRAMRYAGSQPFAVTASAATGVDLAASRAQTRQAMQLVTLIDADAELARLHDDLGSALDWQFGTAPELATDDWLALMDEVAASGSDAVEDAGDGDTLDGDNVAGAAPGAAERDTPAIDAVREAVLARSRRDARQPRVSDAIIDLSRLEDSLSVADVQTGWRLLGARESARGAATQRLIFPGTGRYVSDGERGATPFGLGTVAGQPVKAFPRALEMLAALDADPAARARLDDDGESAFERYDAALDEAGRRLADAQAAEALHLDILRAGLHALQSREPEERHATLLAFDARHRYLDVLYEKQTYTPVGKSMSLVAERPGADLEPAAELYLALATAAREQASRTGIDEWAHYATQLDRLQALSHRRARGESLTPDDERFLNGLDLELRRGGTIDKPIVVDVHTDPGSARVAQLGTGLVRSIRKQGARGARSSFHEFKQPLAERLTNEAWRRRLGPDDPSPKPAASAR